MKGLITLTITVLGFAIFSSCASKSYDESGMSYRSYEEGNIQSSSGDEYNTIAENPFVSTSDESISTFSIDADGAAYSNIRRYLNEGTMPPPDAVRIEEILNYFDYDYKEPTSDPLSINLEMAEAPWNTKNRLVRIGLKGKTIPNDEIPAANYVFLIDVSGSMSSSDKLGLVKYGLNQMVDALDKQDKVGLVTYASSPGVALEPTSCDNKGKIKDAINGLAAGGSTNGEGGIKSAYKLAEKHFIDKGNNRVILCTDGDFNVGLSSQDALVDLIEKEREKGIFLTVVGVGHGNLKDGTMEQLANNGNGTYEYLDSKDQANRVFAEQLSRMVFVAKDVKVQVEFNANVVKQYRLIGYENRVLENDEFDDDKKDAGELGSGQTVTALYEVVLQPSAAKTASTLSFKFRYKEPDGDESQLLEEEYYDPYTSFDNASEELRFAASLAGWGMLLRDSEHKGDVTYDDVKNWAANAQSFDPDGSRDEFINLVNKAKDLDK